MGQVTDNPERHDLKILAEILGNHEHAKLAFDALRHAQPQEVWLFRTVLEAFHKIHADFAHHLATHHRLPNEGQEVQQPPPQ